MPLGVDDPMPDTLLAEDVTEIAQPDAFGASASKRDVDVDQSQWSAWLDALRNRKRRREDALNALEAISLHFSGSMKRCAALLTSDAHSAEDIVQDTLLIAWKAAKRTNEETDLRAWLFGILRNTCRKSLRSIARRQKREERKARVQSNKALSAQELAENSERSEVLRHAMAQLDIDAREILSLRFVESFDVATCAELLGIPQGTVKSRTSASLKKLERHIGDRT